MVLTEHEIQIHIMRMLYFQFFIVYWYNAEPDINISPYQRLIYLCVRIFFDSDFHVRMAFQISLNYFCREEIRDPVRKSERDAVFIAVLFSIYLRENFSVAAHKLLRITQQYDAVIRQRDRRVRAQEQRCSQLILQGLDAFAHALLADIQIACRLVKLICSQTSTNVSSCLKSTGPFSLTVTASSLS